MNFQNISAWSIRNPVVPIVIFIGLMLAGLVSFMRMDVQNDPDIEFPMVITMIAQPGAAPTEIETQITQRVESAVRTIPGVRNISSTASEGSSQTMIEFEIGRDVNQAVNDVKNAIDQARGELPDGILEPQVFKAETSSDPITYFSVSADDMTIEQLSWFVDDTIAKTLLTVPGMAAVERGGGVNREMLVTLDPARMQSLGVTASQVNSALRQLNINAAGGKAEIAGSRQSVRVLGNAASAYDLSQVDVPLGGGRTIKLADIATVSDSFGELTSLGKSGGRPSVSFSIARARGASDVTVYDGAIAKLHQIEKANPGIHFNRMWTTVDYTKQQYSSSMSAMVEGAILAVVVVFFFLRDWRATVISAIAIPLSAIPSFWFMDLMGFTLNQMSLLALGLVAGVLVDDAIVEVENIVRHMRMGKTAYQAAIDAADEIGLAVVATTFSIVAVFLPVGLMPGIPGQFFKNFGLTVVASVLMSLAVARMITPMVAAYFLKAHGEAEHGSGPLMERYMKILRWSLDDSKAKALRAKVAPARGHALFVIGETLLALAVVGVALGAGGALFNLMSASKIKDVLGFELSILLKLAIALVAVLGIGFGVSRVAGLVPRAVGGRYRLWHEFIVARMRARLQDHRVWMLGIAAAALVLTLGLFASLPMQLVPTANSDFTQVRIEMVPGTTLRQTEAVADDVSQIIQQLPEVRNVFQRIGEGNGRVLVTWKTDRDRTSQELERELTARFQPIADARITIQEMNNFGPPGIGRPISIMLSGSDSVLLNKTAATVAEQMKTLPEIVAPRVVADVRRPEIIIKPRQELAASLGVTTTALSQAIRIATLGDIDQNAAKFSLSDRQIPIRVRLPEDARRNLSTIQNLPVPTASGGSVPLSRVADISFGSGPVSIQRYNQQRRVFIGADLAQGVVKGTAMEKINKLPIMKNLPSGVSNRPFGSDQIQAEMMQSFGIALVSAVLLVFAVLVLLYHRFISPLVNMSSLFLAPLGGLIALIIIGQPLSMSVLIGVLMLFGIVAKNSILLIDFAIEEMAAGTAKFEAIMEAGHKRAQPIVMTTVAMTAGMIPTAISISGDGAWRAPMGTVVIGGLMLSTLLTLLIVPAGFSLADGFEKRIGPKLRKSLLTYQPEHGEADRNGPQPGVLPAE